jgi:hypothetical protein
MKVYELIEKLQQCDPNAIVVSYEEEEICAVESYKDFFLRKNDEKIVVLY